MNRTVIFEPGEDQGVRVWRDIFERVSKFHAFAIDNFFIVIHEVHEASSIIQKAAHENANIIFGAVQDETMKDSVKITVIAAGFKDANKKNVAKRPEFLPKTWKAGRELPATAAAAAGAGAGSSSGPGSSVTNEQQTIFHQVQQNVRDVAQDVPADDLDVPTFLRRQAQKA